MIAIAGCWHFAWANRICYLKSGGGPWRRYARDVPDPNVFCGVDYRALDHPAKH